MTVQEKLPMSRILCSPGLVQSRPLQGLAEAWRSRGTPPLRRSRRQSRLPLVCACPGGDVVGTAVSESFFPDLIHPSFYFPSCLPPCSIFSLFNLTFMYNVWLPYFPPHMVRKGGRQPQRSMILPLITWGRAGF